MNKLFKITTILFIITCLFFITSCNNQTDKETYTVTFKDYDGTLLKEEIVEENASVTPPQNPERDGYTFTGWSENYQNITKDLIIIAQYEKISNKCTVTFNTNSQTIIEQQSLEKGDKIKEPTSPTKKGYTFLGWTLNEEIINFTYFIVTEDTTLEAKWVINPYNISYELNGGTTDNPTTYTVEDEITLNNPTKEGYTFIGWTTEENQTPNLNQKIINETGNKHFYANYISTHVHEFIEGKCECGEIEPIEIEYSVLIKDIAGKPLSKFYVNFYLGDELIDCGYTSASGTFKTSQLRNIYEVIIEGRDGYYLNQDTFETDLIGTQIVVECQIDKLVGIEAAPTHMYQLGDVMYDFTITDIENNELNLYTLLEKYDAVILNFWYTTCSACMCEFPAMVEAYESTFKDADGNDVNYKDKIAIIAVNPGFAGDGDIIEEIENFKKSWSLSFNVALDYDIDTTNQTHDSALTMMFGVTAYPTTVFIDRYGLIADVEVGSVTLKDKWTQAFDKYIGNDYTPVYTGEVEEDAYIEPDIEQPDSSLLEDAACGTNYDNTSFTTTFTPETNGEDAKYSWPWINSEYKGLSCIKPSNKDQNPSYSIVYFDVDLKKDQVLAFDYFASTEEYDVLYIIVDGNIATQISGQSKDWETSYAYVALKDAEYEFVLCYMKDGSYSQGDDSVFIRNIRIVETKDIDKETYIFREASNGVIIEFTMSYQEYITPVYNEEDGYYHVGTKNGPLLLADLLSETHWNGVALYEISLEGKCIGNDGVDYNALIEKYAIYSSNSLIGYTPVTKELADALKQIVKALGAEVAQTNINQWLELCVYYSTYGTSGKELSIEQMGLIGVIPNHPIMLEGDGINEAATAEAEFDRIISPRGFIFGFTPTKSGVYKFYSTEETSETVGWICDENGNITKGSDDELRLFAAQLSNGEKINQNFVVYAYLEVGELYLFRAAFSDPFEYSTISVAIEYVSESKELLTMASPSFFDSNDDEISDIISGNYVDVEINEEGYYVVKDGVASDNYLYCDVVYINSIFNMSLLTVLSYKAFDFSKDEFGFSIFDEEGYLRITTGANEEGYIIRCYVCVDKEGNEYYVETIGEGEYTEANGYTYIKLTDEEIAKTPFKDNTEYVREYINTHMVTDKESELYGCVKVDEQFGKVLQELMDKYSFEEVDYSWLKLCYYYRYVGLKKAN